MRAKSVDDLHARAEWHGARLSREHLVQTHGDIFLTKCSRCAFGRRESTEDRAGLPRRAKCGSTMRPGVVWFDEELDPNEVARVERFLAQGACDVVLAIGTRGLFDYIVRWALTAKGANGRLIEINPEDTALSPFATETLRASAGKALPQLVSKLVG
jgi:NAD-dependent deacetylase